MLLRPVVGWQEVGYGLIECFGCSCFGGAQLLVEFGHAKLIRQFRQRPLTQIVSLQQLPTKIVAVRSSHPSSFSHHSSPAKNQLYTIS